ncbi:MAG: AAA family ATPase, partial [Acidobacteriota bacterium]|nr:AAA family ATPase [Acidobacteriota bacterium]
IDGRGGQQPIIEESIARQTIDEISAAQKVTLNDGQRDALKQMLVSRERVIGLQGGAGTGKTTVLASVRVAAERAGYEVEGFAPTTRATALLAESGIKTQTLQRFLRLRQQASDNHHPHLYVLDESSLASTKNLHKFFARIGVEDRVLLVGDARQHQAIEAGSPFEQFQRAGMETARLSEIVRQKDPHLKEVVELLAAGEVRQAVEELQAQGRVIEITDARERLAAIAMDYVQSPDSTLIISPANKERVQINTMVHQALQERGVISREDHHTIVYVNRQEMTGTERTFANSYVPNEDVIRYSRASKVYEVCAGDYGHVVAKNHEQNTITVRLEGGREITYNPERLSGVSVYKEAERQFAQGDRIQFRAPAHELKVANGELGTLEKIEDGRFTVVLDGGRRVDFDARAFPHLDHGYAVTSYSSQGQTVDRVIVNADTHESNLLLNQRMGYVALSRAREDARVYTDSAEELGAALDRQVHKQMALEALRESRSQRQNGAATNRYNRTEEREQKPIRWLHVTAKDPCPVCHKPDNCAVSADRALAYCRRVESDRPGRDGGFLHVLSERPGYAPRLIAPQDEVVTHDRAPIEHRDEVHQDLLAVLDLKDRERKNLSKRGMNEEAASANNYKSVPSRILADAIAEGLAEYHDLRGVPGFYCEEGKDGEPGAWRLNVNYWHQGLMVPVRDIEGRIEGFQIRRAEVKDDSPRYVWLSSSNKLDGTSSGAPIHFRNVEEMRESGRAIITEGALKGDIIAHYTDRGVITVQGVSSFKEDFGKKLREQIPELRRVSIAFDADYARNPNVERAGFAQN